MFMRIFILLIILIAVTIGVLAPYLPRDQAMGLIMFRDVFDTALPILGFGALVKYLCTCCIGSCNCNCNSKK